MCEENSVWNVKRKVKKGKRLRKMKSQQNQEKEKGGGGGGQKPLLKKQSAHDYSLTAKRLCVGHELLHVV